MSLCSKVRMCGTRWTWEINLFFFLRHWNLEVGFCSRSQPILTENRKWHHPVPLNHWPSHGVWLWLVGQPLCFHQWSTGRWATQDCGNIYGSLQTGNIPTSSKRPKAKLRILLDGEQRAEEYALDGSPALIPWKFCVYWKEFKWEPSPEKRVIANIGMFSNNERPGNTTVYTVWPHLCYEEELLWCVCTHTKSLEMCIPKCQRLATSRITGHLYFSFFLYLHFLILLK